MARVSSAIRGPVMATIICFPKSAIVKFSARRVPWSEALEIAEATSDAKILPNQDIRGVPNYPPEFFAVREIGDGYAGLLLQNW